MIRDSLSGSRVISIELWQDYGDNSAVPDEKLKRWASMVETNRTR